MASTPEPPARRGNVDESDGGGDYEVGAAMREGWGGTIRSGRHRRTGRSVTVEDIRADLASTPGLVDRLARSGRDAASLRDARLLRVYDLLDDEGGYHLVAEWSDSPTLDQRLRTGGVSAGQAVAIVDDVLAGLTTLHGTGLCHGHVGPETVLVGADGGAQLAELAICAAAAPAGTGPASDVGEAARLGLHLLRKAGRRLDPVRNLLDGAVATGSGDAAGLREELGATATAVLGAGWREREAAAVVERGRRGRRLVVALIALAAVAGAVATALLLLGHRPAAPARPGPLALVGKPTLSVSPASAGCDTTFVFIARGALSGTGTLVYRWEQSDGEVTSTTSLPIRSNDGAYQLTEAWRLQGSQTVDGGMTLHILEPVDRSVRQTFRYACP